MKEYYIIGPINNSPLHFQVEWEKRLVKIWAGLRESERRQIKVITPPYSEESVSAFLSAIKQKKKERGWWTKALPAFSILRSTPFPLSDPPKLRYWKMVEIPRKAYSIGKHQVTQSLWESVMGSNPSRFKGSCRPVENVSWLDCTTFCNKLSEQEEIEKAYLINGEDVRCNFEAVGYRLPTEWEWYFAAKANQDLKYAGSDNIDEVAWYAENSDGQTQEVGQKKPNAFGLYDVSGNVNEWCWGNWYGNEAITLGSTGPSAGSSQMYCGGSWEDSAWNSRVSIRDGDVLSRRNSNRGIRLCRTIETN